MDISVIVPIWNAENYIERCLRSIFEQTKTDGVEFILVNDCTPDSSMEVARKIIAEYPNLTVRICEHPENRNNGAARQTGLEAAVGDYIMQVDSDDWCEPRMLEELYAKAIETDADIVYCNYYYNDILEELPVYQNGFDLAKSHLEKRWLPGVALWNKLIRRNLFTKYKIAINHGGIHSGEDTYTSIRLFYFADKITHTSSAYYHYYRGYNSNSVTATGCFLDHVMLHNMIEKFCIDNNCNFSQEVFSKTKAQLKLCWLRNSKSSVKQRECIPYYPEADRYILETNNYPWTTKIPYYLATHGLLPLANVIFKISAWRGAKRKKKQ